MKRFLMVLWFIVLLCQISFAFVEPGFVDISDVNSEIKVEMRYASDWNFLGRVGAGYEANKCYLTKEAAEALSKVQKFVQTMGYSVLVFDCYRPQRAVADFMAWTKDTKDQKMKSIFYPTEAKEDLVLHGYVADKSNHSKGSTVDLTLVKNNSDEKELSQPPVGLKFQEELKDCRQPMAIESTGQLDMGTSFDCFHKLANTANPNISSIARKNRKLLKAAMEKFGFVNYSKEWWHFSLKNEPFKNKYFDFVIQ